MMIKSNFYKNLNWPIIHNWRRIVSYVYNSFIIVLYNYNYTATHSKTATLDTSREIYSEDADDGTGTQLLLRNSFELYS